MSHFIVRRVAVLGAGVMGAQIAAYCANAGLEAVLFDLPGEHGGSVAAEQAIERLDALRPPPLATPRHARAIRAANYDDDLALLGECELVIEAIAERIDLKRALFGRIAPFLRHDAVIATNTSGLSVHELSDALPAPLRARFCGVHFFNPPRYMALIELIAGPDTEPALLDRLESWLTTRLGKSVVRARDTPNFIANRIGMFAMLAVMHHTTRLGLGFDEADALTGPAIGRPRSATFRTADVVGLDTLAHVVATLRDRLPDDPWHPWFGEPEWLTRLLARGALGAKSGEGVYRRDGQRILVLDGDDYRESAARIAPEVADILAERDPAKRLERLRACPHPQAELLWASFRDLFHYAAHHLAAIADNAREVDLAMRWGFGWAHGPFETWQAAGWRAVAEAIAADIEAARAMADVALPDWVTARDGVHETAGSWSASDRRLHPRTALTVYVRQSTLERVYGEHAPEHGDELWRNAGVRLWRRPDLDPRVGIVSFTTRAHVIGEEVLDGLAEALARAARDLDALVIWHEPPFTLGADLAQVLELCDAGEHARLERMLERFQHTSLAMRSCAVPVVAAVHGMALGGGCEFLMHAAHRVFAFESQVGLVETGVGLIPAGGGSTALAVRADRLARLTRSGDPFAFVEHAFAHVVGASVSTSAPHALELGYAREADDIVMHPRELLYVALVRARSLADAGWHAPLKPRDIVVAGREGIARLEAGLDDAGAGGRMSAHDRRVARAAAVALCGGDVAAGTAVSEDWLLAVEREQFMALLGTPATQARMRHTLDTGKPLRN
ncbi:3-hydroxyacyl-CoA dehydrogenase/enoyl-CoA hydratase family protein [Pseudazoarcus pumilus]|uniref:3-hydroxyacyl-CoA dehydrogenase n=1 Tax=Pseudazoarcus pumilus TaxID=2067960 RepID=A0A2I6S3H3_9RHOO|nr:3-hydroxyacyl-CoA dehydrogenase/enoyl-CoA hydratase family protein [Pseudazoarcus pumilus]AUN93819.1 3-hydroxyacyl-CoA dehydrogenase [Pseudazoarcus pumilus]